MNLISIALDVIYREYRNMDYILFYYFFFCFLQLSISNDCSLSSLVIKSTESECKICQ